MTDDDPLLVYVQNADGEAVEAITEILAEHLNQHVAVSNSTVGLEQFKEHNTDD